MWEALILSLWGDEAPTAFRVVGCESGWDPNNVNPTSDARGLFQILHGPLDPIANIRLAYRMYALRGWQPWISSRTCWGQP